MASKSGGQLLCSLYELPAELLAGSSAAASSKLEVEDFPPLPEDANSSGGGGGEPPLYVGPSETERESSTSEVTAHWSQAGATCLTCGVGFDTPGFSSPDEQRLHFKSDWHRLNLKRRLGGQAALGEEAFEKLVDGGGSDCESISGSDTDSDIEEEADAENAEGAALPRKGPKAVFNASDGRRLSVWRCLLEPAHRQQEDQGVLPGVTERLRALRDGGVAGRWAVVLASGGHFAAAVFQWKEVKGKGGKASSSQPEAILHKTFHKYVVRAKAGGRQSTKDATGKSIKSAGSALRRANEAALAKNIRETMASWKDELARAHLIFIHSSRSDTATLFVGDDAPFSRADPRVRRIPFPTRRPTLSETKRTVTALANVWVAPKEEALREERRKAATGRPASANEGASAAAAAAASQRPRKVEEEVEAEAEPRVPDSALHSAARSGDAEVVRRRLEAGEDPCVKDHRGRPPYDVAVDKPTRDAFRRFMAAEPDKWDYTCSNIPSALTSELEEAQEAKRAEKEAKRKEKEKERKKAVKEKKKKAAEEAKAAAEADIEAAAAAAAAQAAKLRLGGGAGSKRGGGGSGSTGSKQQVRAEAEAAKRREAMAAAAEARMKALQSAQQQQQLW